MITEQKTDSVRIWCLTHKSFRNSHTDRFCVLKISSTMLHLDNVKILTLMQEDKRDSLPLLYANSKAKWWICLRESEVHYYIVSKLYFADDTRQTNILFLWLCYFSWIFQRLITLCILKKIAFDLISIFVIFGPWCKKQSNAAYIIKLSIVLLCMFYMCYMIPSFT